jgi:predicted glycogen debranching enzyme
MSYIKFDKNQLINLEYSLSKELIRSNRAGAYASKTIIGCNTRKYHGLLVVPQPALDGDPHVLLSNLDETIIQHGTEFNLGIHKFPGGVYSPKGHKYVRDFNTNPIPSIIYHVGGVVLRREIILTSSDDRVLMKYTLEDAHSPTMIRFRPFLAFRNAHMLSKANVYVNTKYQAVKNGIRMKLYPGYSNLYMQFSKEPEYTHVPDWYYNIEYQQEMERGYDYQEDLFVPGFFDVKIKKGESVIFCAGTEEIDPPLIKKAYVSEVGRRVPRDTFENCLMNSAQQFIVKRGSKTEIIAGFPWFGRMGRDTFVALPGLMLVTGDHKTAKAVIDTIVREMNGPLFPNIRSGEATDYQSVDAPLWFFWTLQQYAEFTKTGDKIWKEYGRKMKAILEGYRDGAPYHIKMLDNGLISAGEKGKALTWMDAIIDGKPVTPRIGMAVEINALWYNAIMFALELAKKDKDTKFVKGWQKIADKIPAAFTETFWDDDKGYLADYVNDDEKDWSVRPNMVFATSLPYVPLGEEKRNAVLEVIRQELLTPRGLRTLTPKNPHYKGVYCGNQKARDEAYHQGSVFPWLLGHFAEGYLRIHNNTGIPFIDSLYHGFEQVMTEHGIGTVSEIYDGDPPHKAGGAVSQAWSVAEVLRIHWLLNHYNRK